MAKNTIYKITLLNWNEHNPGKKKIFKKTLIANNLISDAKILSLPLSHRWLFINLLLICGDHANDTVTMTQRQLNEILTTKEGAHNALARLQSLQLLSYEKIDSLIKEVKEKKEVVVKEKIDEEKTIKKDDGSFINLPQIKAAHPVDNFHARLTSQSWLDVLTKWKLAFPQIKNNLAKLQERFESSNDLEEFLDKICDSKVYKELKNKNDKAGCDRYISAALLKEMGLR